MSLFYIIIIALVNNLDNIGVRIAYSLRGIKITVTKNLWISAITFAISLLAAYFGNVLAFILPKHFVNIFCMLLLVAFGIWIIIEPYLKKASANKHQKASTLAKIIEQPENADMDNSKDIDFTEATLLGIALSIDNIGGGFSAGVMGLNCVFIGLFSAVIGFISLWLGNYAARLLIKWNFGRRATVIAGIVLICMGIKQVIL